MVFLVIRNCKDLELERHLVDLDSQNSSDSQQQQIQSNTIESLSTMASNSGNDEQSIIAVQLRSLAIRWRAEAYKQTMEIHSVTHKLYEAQQLTLDTRLYRRFIDLLVQPRVQVLQDHSYARETWRRQFVRLQCKAEDGLPALMPRFMEKPGGIGAAAGGELLRRLAGENYSTSEDGRVSVATVVLNVTSSSQLDQACLRCVVGSIQTVVVLRVVHHPESMEISWPTKATAVGVNQSILLSSGDSLRCSNVGGYPSPTIVWTVVARPPDRNFIARFLSFSSSSPGNGNNSNDNVVTIINQPPEWSMWQLNCSITSVVNTSTQIVTFIIRENKEIDASNLNSFSMVTYLQFRLINLEKTSNSIVELLKKEAEKNEKNSPN